MAFLPTSSTLVAETIVKAHEVLRITVEVESGGLHKACIYPLNFLIKLDIHFV